MRSLKIVSSFLVSLLMYGCNPAWAQGTPLESEESNYELLSGTCSGRFISVILSHESQVFRDQRGNIRLPEHSELMLLPCGFRTTLERCESRRGVFHWSLKASYSVEGESFQCLNAD